MESRTIYFENGGEANTDVTLAAARQRAKEFGIKTVVVASSRGATAIKAVNVFNGMKVVIVGHEYGHMEPNTTDFLDENRKIVESKGGKILAGIHGFGGINNAFSSRPAPPKGGFPPPGAPAGGPPPGGMPAPSPVPGRNYRPNTRSFFQGNESCGRKITIMAAEFLGLIRTDEDVIVIAGKWPRCRHSNCRSTF